MTGLEVGAKVMHNCCAMELLYRVAAASSTSEVWKVKLLFVSPEERLEQFIEGDRISYLHTRNP